MQVILKPDPGNPQELYLGSLEALGIDTRAHDVRLCLSYVQSPTTASLTDFNADVNLLYICNISAFSGFCLPIR